MWCMSPKGTINQINIEIQTVYGRRYSPLGFTSPKGTLNQIDIWKRTFYGQRCSPLEFISPKGTLHRTDIEIRTIYGQRSGPHKFISAFLIWCLNPQAMLLTGILKCPYMGSAILLKEGFFCCWDKLEG